MLKKIPLDVVNQFTEKGLPKNFCIVPFKTLIFNPSGNISVCRIKGTNHTIGSLNEESAIKIWNNDKMVQWRKEFLSGKVTTCAMDIERENCNIMPENYEIWPEIDPSGFQTGAPIKFTANFNGQCNLKCIMCKIWTMENGYYDQINFWENAEREFFPFIKEVEMLSGEPFIQKDTYKLIDIISGINPGCHWSFTTNAHWKMTPKITESLDKIKISNMIISIDSFSPTKYAEIRKGGELKTVLKTTQDLIEYNESRKKNNLEPFTITIHFLVMKDNWQELSNVFNFVKERKLKLNLKNLEGPIELSLHSLNDQEKLDIIKSTIHNCSSECLRALNRFFSALIQAMNDLTYKAEALVCLRDGMNEQ